jgi:hypothetical protein
MTTDLRLGETIPDALVAQQRKFARRLRSGPKMANNTGLRSDRNVYLLASGLVVPSVVAVGSSLRCRRPSSAARQAR